jgi:hypothetical protein
MTASNFAAFDLPSAVETGFGQLIPWQQATFDQVTTAARLSTSIGRQRLQNLIKFIGKEWAAMPDLPAEEALLINRAMQQFNGLRGTA